MNRWALPLKAQKLMAKLTLVEGPQERFLDRDMVKSHLHISTTADDDRVDEIIRAAEGMLDGSAGYLGRAIMPQTWRLDLSDWPPNAIVLPLPPLISVESIVYLDSDGDAQTLDTTYYRTVIGEPGKVILEYGKTWPTTLTDQPDAVRVTFIAGYRDLLSPTNNPVPGVIVMAGVLIAGMLYDNPMSDIPESVRSLLASSVVHRMGGYREI